MPVLREAARLAREKELHSLLVVSGLDDPATPGAVCAAMEELHALGAPPPFRIAFVAALLPPYSAYRAAERCAARFGIAARVLVSLRDAEHWLGLREAANEPMRPG